jgi:hypothetical protein
MVKCSRRAPGERLVLLAKQYRVRVDEEVSAEKLATEVYKKDYEKLFKSFAYTSKKPALQQGKAAYEVWIDAEHATRGKIRKRERVATAPGGFVLIVSAEGTPSELKRYDAEHQAWFRNARFAVLN